MSEANKSAPHFVTSNASEKLELTAYQGGQAVVRERRTVKLTEGTSHLALQGLPEQFVQGSLTVVNVEGKGKFKLGPISYRPANLSAQSILQQAIGQKIELIENTPTGKNRIRGKLQFILGNNVVLETGSGIQVMPLTTSYELPDGMPHGLTSKPSLFMEPTVAEAGEFGIDILYETDGIGWNSRYEAFYNAKEEKISRLVCWVDLSNNSGAALKDAKFKLIAQSNHGMRMNASPPKAAAFGARAAGGAGLESAMSFDAPGGSVESVGEQKMYALPDALSLESGESKQTMLLFAENVPVTPEYFLGYGHYHHGVRKHEDAQKLPVHVRLRLKNDKASQLGSALPPGEMVVFESDSSGAPQKTDGSNVSHVAEDEAFKLALRNACKELKATRVLVDHKEDPQPAPQPRARVATPGQVEEQPTPRFREEEREVRLYNFKDKAVTVEVTEALHHNELEFLSASEQFTAEAKKSGVLSVSIAPKSETTVRYRVKFRVS